MPAQKKITVLFLCTGNSCRSQMAEGWTRHLKRNLVEAHSAGVNPKGVDPRAVKAMAETGVDISKQGSKSLDEIRHIEFDYVITLCDNAHKTCPIFPAKTRVMHVGFEDPPRLAEKAKDEEEAMAHYRRIRDEIRVFVDGLPERLFSEESGISANQQLLFESGIESFLNQMPKEHLHESDDREEDK
ncbi:MAG: arsenate reductase ArsC [Deltaproteobacteria bacterium]|nr:MAG: arsenate reductase ArsC [Deltaproteobacteria bacterium]